MGKFGSKIKYISLRRNSFNGHCHFFSFSLEIPFLGKVGPNNWNCHFKLKFGTYNNSNIQNSVMLFTFFVFDWKYLCWANLVQKIKILSLSWNLIRIIIRICRIQWWCTVFSFSSGNALFYENWPKKSKLSVEAEISKLD